MAGRGDDPGTGPRTRRMPALPGEAQPGGTQPGGTQPGGTQPGGTRQARTQPGGTQPGGRRDGAARQAGGPRDVRGRRNAQPPQRRGRWGALQGGLGVCIIVASGAVGTIATIVARSTPGVLLGFFVVAGTVTAALAVRPRAGRMILPVPVLSYLVAALTSGLLYSRSADTSRTALAIGAAQWIADGFFAMTLATVLAVAITTARWYLWRRRRPATRDPGWPAATGRAAPPRRPRAAWETSAESGYPAGFAGPGAPREAGETAAPGGHGDWGDADSRGRGRRQEPRSGTGPYNFSSGA